MKSIINKPQVVRWVTVVFGLLLLGGCAVPIQEEAVVRPVKVLVLSGSSEGGSRVFPGIVQAAQRARLSFRVSGPLVQVPVFRGEQVRQGQLLAQIDPRDFQTAVENLEARVANLQAQYSALQVARPEDIRSAEANLAATRARLLEANATLRRYQRLYENDNVSKAEYDQRLAARQVAEAEVRRAEEGLTIARTGARAEDIQAMEAQIRAMKAQLKQAGDQLKDTSLQAPYAGIVAEIYVENFEFVQAQQSTLSLQDVSTVEVVAQIPEAIVARGRRDLMPEFAVRFESLPGQEFEAEATEVAAEADPVTRTYAVTFQTPQPETGTILAGMTAEVLLKERSNDEFVFNVPVSAVFTDEMGQQSVWILDEQSMTVGKAQVEVGALAGGSVTLLSGVSPGQTIVTAGASFLAEGQKVREITDELRERR
ncbi:MAG: efflux RND transporter periplasmic adaptor subunit [Acidobacteria bacterium]|nr:efflux RND transporter periplasmic adaptor subunit [Acidobacteriota bacterium]